MQLFRPGKTPDHFSHSGSSGLMTAAWPEIHHLSPSILTTTVKCDGNSQNERDAEAGAIPGTMTLLHQLADKNRLMSQKFSNNVRPACWQRMGWCHRAALRCPGEPLLSALLFLAHVLCRQAPEAQYLALSSLPASQTAVPLPLCMMLIISANNALSQGNC